MTQRRDWSETVATVAIIAGAGAASFHGLRDLALDGGFPWWVATTLPLLLDGAALATATPWRDRSLSAATRRHAGTIAVGLLLGSILGNVADVLGLGATVGARVLVGAVAPLVLGLVLHLQRQVRTDRELLAGARVEHLNAVELAEETRTARQRAERDAAAADAAAQRAAEQWETARQHAADADADEALASEHTIYAELLRCQARHDQQVEADALHQAQTARDERFRVAAEQPAAPAATPARKPVRRQRGEAGARQPEPIPDLVARAKPILAEEEVGRNVLAERLDCTPDRARKVLKAIRDEQSAAADPLEEAFAEPAAEPARHVNGAIVGGEH